MPIARDGHGVCATLRGLRPETCELPLHGAIPAPGWACEATRRVPASPDFCSGRKVPWIYTPGFASGTQRHPVIAAGKARLYRGTVRPVSNAKHARPLGCDQNSLPFWRLRGSSAAVKVAHSSYCFADFTVYS
jgi:hypothetical protein